MGQGEQGVVADVRAAVAPPARPHLRHDGGEVGRHVMRSPAVNGRVEEVDRRGCGVLVGVDEHEAVTGGFRHPVEQIADQVAFGRVERRDAAPGLDVVEDHVHQQRGLTGAGRAERVHVVAAVRQRDPDPSARAGVGDADHLAAQAVPLVERHQIEPALRAGAGPSSVVVDVVHRVLQTVGRLSSGSSSGFGTSGLGGAGSGRRVAGPVRKTSRPPGRRREAAAGRP